MTVPARYRRPAKKQRKWPAAQMRCGVDADGRGCGSHRSIGESRGREEEVSTDFLNDDKDQLDGSHLPLWVEVSAR